MRTLKAKPFKIDPKERQSFTSVVTAETFPIAAKDAKTIELFVKEFTESLPSVPGTGSLRSGPKGKRLRVSYVRRKKAGRRRDRLSRPLSHRLP